MSKPIAKFSPISDIQDFKEATDEEIEKAAMEDWGDEFLSEEDLKYYMALKVK